MAALLDLDHNSIKPKGWPEGGKPTQAKLPQDNSPRIWICLGGKSKKHVAVAVAMRVSIKTRH